MWCIKNILSINIMRICCSGKGGRSNVISIENNERYYDLIKDVRNSVDLTKESVEFLSKLSHENLIEIIIIYSNLVKMYKEMM